MEVDEGIYVSDKTEGGEEPMEVEEDGTADRVGTLRKRRHPRRLNRNTPFKDGSLVVVFDTSILLESPDIVKKSTDAEINVVIPYKVVEELDRFKNSECSRNQAHATAAVSVMHDLLTFHNEYFTFESTFESNSHLDGLRCRNNDDYILKCALTYLTRYAHAVHVLLATDDKNLTLKAAANRLRAVTAEQLDILIDQKKRKNCEHSNEHAIAEGNQNTERDSNVEESKDVEALLDFSFTIPSTSVQVEIPEMLKCFGSSVASMQSVFADNRRERKLSEGMLEFLDYCEAVVAEIHARRDDENGDLSDNTVKLNGEMRAEEGENSVFSDQLKSEDDAIALAHSRDLLSAFGNTRRFKIGSIAEMVKKVEYMISVYLDEEVIFDVEALSNEYPTVCMEAGKRLGVFQKQLW